jgi:hypothetical protein
MCVPGGKDSWPLANNDNVIDGARHIIQNDAITFFYLRFSFLSKFLEAYASNLFNSVLFVNKLVS